MGWMEDDICWCANSNLNEHSPCPHTECFRHLSNRHYTGVFTMGYLKDTESCPLTEKRGVEDEV